jgi:hypothetical protein
VFVFRPACVQQRPQRLRNQAVAELRGTSRVWIRTWRQERALPSGPLNWEEMTFSFFFILFFKRIREEEKNRFFFELAFALASDVFP